MDARIASNVETAALLPEGASVTSNQAKFSNIEQARADYLRGLHSMNAELQTALRRACFLGSREAAAKVIARRFSPDEVRKLENRST